MTVAATVPLQLWADRSDGSAMDDDSFSSALPLPDDEGSTGAAPVIPGGQGCALDPGSPSDVVKYAVLGEHGSGLHGLPSDEEESPAAPPSNEPRGVDPLSAVPMSPTDDEEMKEGEAANGPARVTSVAPRTAIVLPRIFEAHKDDFWNVVNVRLPKAKGLGAFREALGWGKKKCPEWQSRQKAMRELLVRLELVKNEPLPTPTKTRKEKRLYMCPSWRTDLTLPSRGRCPWKPDRAWHVACKCLFNRCRDCGWDQYAYYPEVLWWAHLVWNANQDKFPRNAPSYPTLDDSLEMLERYSEGLATSLLMDATGQLLMVAWLEEEHPGVAQGFLNAARHPEVQQRELWGILIDQEEKHPADQRVAFPHDGAEMDMVMGMEVDLDVHVRGQSVPCSPHVLMLVHRRLRLDEVLTALQVHVQLRDRESLFRRARQRSAVRMWWKYRGSGREPELLEPDAFWHDYDLLPEHNATLVVELCADEPPVVGLPGGAEDDPADLQLLTEDVKMPEDDGAAMRPVHSFEPRDELRTVLSSSSSSSVFSRSSLPASQEPQPPLAAPASTSSSLPLPSSGWSPSRAGPGHHSTGPRSAGGVKQPVNTDSAAQLRAYLQHREARGDITYSRAYYSRAIVLRRLCQTTNAVHRTVEQDVDRALKLPTPPPRAQEIKDYIELLKRQQEEEQKNEREQPISQGSTAEVNEEVVSSEDDGDSDDEPDDSSEDEDAPSEPVNELKVFIEAAVQSALPNQVSDLLRFLLDQVGVRCMDDLAVLTWRAHPETPMLYALTDPETRQLLLPAQQSLSGGFMDSVISIIDQRSKQEAARHVFLHPWHRQLLSSAVLTPADERFVTHLLHELYGCLVEGLQPAAHRQLTTRWLLDAKLEEKKVGKAQEAVEEDEDNSWLTDLVAIANISVTPLLCQPPIVLPPDEPSRAETALCKLICDFPRFRRYTALSQRRLLVMVMELLYVYSSVYLRQRQDPDEALTALVPSRPAARPIDEAMKLGEPPNAPVTAVSLADGLVLRMISEATAEDSVGPTSNSRENDRRHHLERSRELWRDVLSSPANAVDRAEQQQQQSDDHDSDPDTHGDLHAESTRAGAAAHGYGGSQFSLVTPLSGSEGLPRCGVNA